MSTQTDPDTQARPEPDDSFRRRVFTPLVLPFTVVGGILLFAISFSRILLAVPALISTLLAVLLAGYVLMIAGMVANRRSISSRALGVGVVLGFAGVVAGGVVAAAAGPRDFHEEEAHAAGEGEEGAPEIPEGALVWEAEQALVFTSAPETATAGEVPIVLVNPSGQPHNVTIEGVNNDEPIVEVSGGVGIDTVTLEPGEYRYFCSIAGHEPSMSGTLSVT